MDVIFFILLQIDLIMTTQLKIHFSNCYFWIIPLNWPSLLFTFDLKKIFRFIWSDGPWIERFFKENRMFQCNSKSYKEENACSSSLVIITLEMKHSRQQSKDFCQTLDFKTNSYCLKITQNVVFFWHFPPIHA